MSLLLLFSDQIPAAGDATTTVLVETDPGVWYDVSADLISGDVRRGRAEELDEFNAGTCALLFDNDDRTFDPNHTTSPLFGYIRPMQGVQVRNTFDGVTYPLFAGYADRWTQNREGPHRGTTELTATDGFKVLARADLAASVYAYEVATDGPVAWWRLDEQGGTVAHDQIGDVDLAARNTPTMGDATLVARDPGSSASFDDDVTFDDGFILDTPTLPINGGPLTVEAVVRSDTGDVADGVVTANITYLGGTGFVLSTDAASGFVVAAVPAAGVVTGISGSAIQEDGAVHHLCGVWNSDGTVKIYIDGVDRTVGAPTTAVGSFNQAAGTVVIGAFDEDGMVGGVDEVAFYDYALPLARIQAHAAAVTTPWDGDLPGPRIERVLDAVGWSDTARDVDTGTTTLQPAELDMPALEHVQKVAASEFGQVYVTGGGVLRFEARDNAVNQTPVAAFSDAAGTDLPIMFSSAQISDEQIRNDISVSRLDGTAQRVRDADSIAQYQISSYTRDGLYHDTDTHSRAGAEYLLANYKTPAERVDQMVVNPYADPANLWPAILGIELTDWVTLEETPQNTGDPVARTVSVEGIAHTFGPKTWEATFDLGPVSAAGVGIYWQLGETGFSELGETTRLFF